MNDAETNRPVANSFIFARENENNAALRGEHPLTIFGIGAPP